MTYIEVPREEVAAFTRGRQPHPAALALASGKVLFIPEAEARTIEMMARHPNGFLRARGFRARTQRGVREGVRGMYIWAEKAEEPTP
jgi:hypothetical protein